MISNLVTIVGNLVDDPELRYTPNGAPVVNFRIASTPRFYDNTAKEWKDGETVFLTVTQWRTPGENVAASLSRGNRVVVVGRLEQRSYETKEGEKRTVYELQADEVAASLQFAEVEVRVSRQTRKQDDRRERNQREDNRPSRRPRENANSRQASRRTERDRDSARGSSEGPWNEDNNYSDEPPF